MDPESEHVREVFAWYGAAMYRACCVERQIALVLSGEEHVGQASQWRVEDALREDFERTFGGLVKRLRQVVSLPADIEEQLESALKKRNWLAHDYWYERAVDFATFDGRDRMIAELELVVDEFRQLDSYLTERNNQRLRQLGIPVHDPAYMAELVNDLFRKGDEWLPRGRRPKKTESLIACYYWRPSEYPDTRRTCLFEADDGSFFMLCESGFMRGPAEVKPDELERVAALNKALPAVVNSRCTTSEPYRWEIPLANGYYLWSRPVSRKGICLPRWGLTRDVEGIDDWVRRSLRGEEQT